MLDPRVELVYLVEPVKTTRSFAVMEVALPPPTTRPLVEGAVSRTPYISASPTSFPYPLRP